MDITVLTLVKGRNNALLNLVKGLSLNQYNGMELIIVHMNEEICTLPITSFPIRSISLFTEEKLPLAKARNLAISQAKAAYCIFLDVDCIPAADFISVYAKAFLKSDSLWSGCIRYLRDGFSSDLERSALDQWSDADPIRSNLNPLPYELFWSLNFGCSKSVFNSIGWFDENYQGYGAEDTDFSFMARKKGIQISNLAATAYHQPHPSYDPPLNHLEDIVKNATVFHDKWHRWPMEGWLSKFAELGYILWNDKQLILLNLPTQQDIEKYLKKT